MRNLRIPLRVVFYQDEGRWYAHCLEFGLLGDGATREAALTSLGSAIEVQASFSLEHGNAQSLFCPAEPRFFEMFAAGQDVTVGELHVQLPGVTIEDTRLREYVPEPSERPIPVNA